MIKKNKLIEARNKRGYSQDYLAGALDINVSKYIERLEDENRNLKDEIGLLKEHLKS